MKIFAGGARGSHPRHGAAFQTYGGATTSFGIRGSRGEWVVLDAGTGFPEVRQFLAAESEPPEEALLLLTHPHIDHLAGLLGCGFVHGRRPEWRIGTSVSLCHSIREAIGKLFAPPLWPCSWEAAAGHPRWLQIGETSADPGLRWGDMNLRACPVAHPGGCAAFRIEEWSTGLSVVFATDMEWRAMDEAHRGRFLDFCAYPHPPTLLVLDGQYAAHELEAHAGWGHTAREDAAEIASRTRAHACWITHHDPGADDDALAAAEAELRRLHPACSFARAGRSLALGGSMEQ